MFIDLTPDCFLQIFVGVSYYPQNLPLATFKGERNKIQVDSDKCKRASRSLKISI